MALADKKLKMGIVALKEGRKDEARGYLQDAVSLDPSSSKAWLWLSQAVDDRAMKRECLEKVLEINPKNTLAQEELEAMGRPPEGAVDTLSKPADVLREILLAQRRQEEALERLVGQQERLLSSLNTIKNAAVVWLLLVGLGVLLGCILAAVGGGLLP